MSTTLAFKDFIDLPKWRPNAPATANTAAGMSLAYDHGGGAYRHPNLYLLRSATVLETYSPLTDEWMSLLSPALAGTFGAGACAVFHPTLGPRGTLAAGATASTVTLATALPAAVLENVLANEAAGFPVRIRILGNAAGSSGKIEVRNVTANTAGATPTLTLDAPLSFVPVAGDGYEITSGRVYLLGAGTVAAGIWKYYDVATGTMSGNLATSGLPASVATDTSLLALSEGHVPCDRLSGEGFLGTVATYDTAPVKRCVLATASGASSITGSGLPSTLFADEYRNFQIRIVEDVTTPTAVGQRRRISTHTSGADAVFTVAAWAVTPSADAKFVVENDDSKVLLAGNASATIWTYDAATDGWSSATFAAAGTASGAGVQLVQPFGMTRDETGGARHSYVTRVRGAATADIDVLDIAGAAAGLWRNNPLYRNRGLTTFTTGTCAAYNPWTNDGRYLYLTHNGTQRHLRYDLRHSTLEPSTFLRVPGSSAVVGKRAAMCLFLDGETKVPILFDLLPTSNLFFSRLIKE